MSKTSLKFIKTLPKQIFCELNGKKIYIVHYPIDDNMKFKKHIKMASLKENEEMFENINSDIFIYGHTHVNIYNKNLNKFYINPGALGCPRKYE